MATIDLINMLVEKQLILRYNKLKDAGVEPENEESEDVISELIDDARKVYLHSIYDSMYHIVHDRRLEDAGFNNSLEQKWGDVFVQLEAFRWFNIELAEEYQELLSKQDPKQLQEKYYRNIVLREIHGRACQIFLEITCLLKNGLADGAFSRWRSLYELAVVANFIRNDDETVAKAYFDSADSNDTQNEWARASSRFTLVNRITFSALQDKVGYDKESVWNKQYKLANCTVHSGSQGTFKRISLSETPQAILAGKSDYGIHLPAEHAVISLAQIMGYWISLFELPEVDHNIYVLDEWQKDFQYRVYEVANQLFPDDEEIKEAFNELKIEKEQNEKNG